MSAPDQPTAATPAYPEPTQADRDAAFASVIWFHKQREAGAFDQYEGMYVAILGEQIIDADRDKEALFQRLDAKGDEIPLNRLVVKYLYTFEDDLNLGSRVGSWPVSDCT